jgi:hypothetical protein
MFGVVSMNALEPTQKEEPMAHTDDTPTPTTVLGHIAALQRMSMPELQARWRALTDTDPPSYNKAFLLKRLIHRVQELAYGGLPMAAHGAMEQALAAAGYDELGGARDETRAVTPASPARKPGHPVVGTRLVREWNGQRYEVVATHDGFEFEGRPYKSLTGVTKAITGTHWNGMVFFGLRKKTREDA